MTKIEIGIGAVIASAAGFAGASDVLNFLLLGFGVGLVLHGGYYVYIQPNFWLDKTLRRWLERRYWKVSAEEVDKGTFYFALWAEDDAGRKILVSRGRQQSRLLAFTANVALDQAIVHGIRTRLTPDEQQRLYQDLQVLLASMQLGYRIGDFTTIAVQDALPLDEQLSEHGVDLKAKAVSNGYAAARSLIGKAVS